MAMSLSGGGGGEAEAEKYKSEQGTEFGFEDFLQQAPN